MQGLYYLMSIIAVAVVVLWYLQNDQRSSSEPTIGLLRMPAASSEATLSADGNAEIMRRS